MLVHQRSAAVLAALLLTALPASATLITSPVLQITDEIVLQPNSPLLEFDVEDWASFISSNAPEYQLSALGLGIDAFGEASAFRMPRPNDVDNGDGRILTRVSKRP